MFIIDYHWDVSYLEKYYLYNPDYIEGLLKRLVLKNISKLDSLVLIELVNRYFESKEFKQ